MRFSLRTLLIVMLLGGPAIAWLSRHPPVAIFVLFGIAIGLLTAMGYVAEKLSRNMEPSHKAPPVLHKSQD